MRPYYSLLFSFLILCSTYAYAGVSGTYGIHLFFNEKEFIDTITIAQSPDGRLVGQMDVPRDFRGPLHNLKVVGRMIEFDVLVPKNQSRPKDIVFHYAGYFFDDSHTQLIGFVTTQGSKNFTASFTGFK